MRSSIVFFLLAITFGRSLSQHCEEDESQMNLKPILDYIATLRKRVECYEAKQPPDTLSKIALIDEKLATLGKQLAIRQELEKRSEEQIQKLELQLASERKEVDTKLESLQKLEMISREKIQKLELQLSFERQVIDKKLETLGTQLAIQQEVEKTSEEKFQEFFQQLASERKEVKEKLESLQKLEKISQEKIQKFVLQLGETKPTTTNLELFKKSGSKYYYVESEWKNELNWHDALKKCREMGAHLASVQSDDEINALYRVMYPGIIDYWIDLNDLKTEGKFISATTGVEGNFFRWWEGQPSNSGNSHCVVLLRLPPIKSAKMGVYQCLDKVGFICEMSLEEYNIHKIIKT